MYCVSFSWIDFSLRKPREPFVPMIHPPCAPYLKVCTPLAFLRCFPCEVTKLFLLSATRCSLTRRLAYCRFLRYIGRRRLSPRTSGRRFCAPFLFSSTQANRAHTNAVDCELMVVCCCLLGCPVQHSVQTCCQ